MTFARRLTHLQYNLTLAQLDLKSVERTMYTAKNLLFFRGYTVTICVYVF